MEATHLIVNFSPVSFPNLHPGEQNALRLAALAWSLKQQEDSELVELLAGAAVSLFVEDPARAYMDSGATGRMGYRRPGASYRPRRASGFTGGYHSRATSCYRAGPGRGRRAYVARTVYCYRSPACRRFP